MINSSAQTENYSRQKGSLLRGIGAIETIAIKNNEFINFDAHRHRLEKAYQFFGIEDCRTSIDKLFDIGLIEFLKYGQEGLLRVYLPYNQGHFEAFYLCSIGTIPTEIALTAIAFQTIRYLPKYDFKHMSRMVYHNDSFESFTILKSALGFICEGINHTLILYKGGFYFTPASPALASPSTSITSIIKQGFRIYDAYIKEEDFINFQWAIAINSGSFVILYDTLKGSARSFLSQLDLFKR